MSSIQGVSNHSDRLFKRIKHCIIKFSSFLGPGFVIAVAYSKLPCPGSLHKATSDSDREGRLSRHLNQLTS
jgi:hypothetical protein